MVTHLAMNLIPQVLAEKTGNGVLYNLMQFDLEVYSTLYFFNVILIVHFMIIDLIIIVIVY